MFSEACVLQSLIRPLSPAPCPISPCNCSEKVQESFGEILPSGKHYFIIRQHKATTDGITSMRSAHRWSNSDSACSGRVAERHHRSERWYLARCERRKKLLKISTPDGIVFNLLCSRALCHWCFAIYILWKVSPARQWARRNGPKCRIPFAVVLAFSKCVYTWTHASQYEW